MISLAPENWVTKFFREMKLDLLRRSTISPLRRRVEDTSFGWA
ncbi:hypothetical protein PCPL58_p1044 (plasmid) [Pseudomonas cerasi]|nr:hypothetical protein PCPL58_p1044 [Pseudomonas cerasi]